MKQFESLSLLTYCNDYNTGIFKGFFKSKILNNLLEEDKKLMHKIYNLPMDRPILRISDTLQNLLNNENTKNGFLFLFLFIKSLYNFKGKLKNVHLGLNMNQSKKIIKF